MVEIGGVVLKQFMALYFIVEFWLGYVFYYYLGFPLEHSRLSFQNLSNLRLIVFLGISNLHVFLVLFWLVTVRIKLTLFSCCDFYDLSRIWVGSRFTISKSS